MRSRPLWLGLTLGTIVLGLLTRPLKRYNDALGSALGDGLWAAMVYLLLGVLFPRLAPRRLLGAALLTASAVEVSQLWHPPWLDTLRHTALGALAIGGSFSQGDLLYYALGIVVGHLLLKNSVRSTEDTNDA